MRRKERRANLHTRDAARILRDLALQPHHIVRVVRGLIADGVEFEAARRRHSVGVRVARVRRRVEAPGRVLQWARVRRPAAAAPLALVWTRSSQAVNTCRILLILYGTVPLVHRIVGTCAQPWYVQYYALLLLLVWWTEYGAAHIDFRSRTLAGSRRGARRKRTNTSARPAEQTTCGLYSFAPAVNVVPFPLAYTCSYSPQERAQKSLELSLLLG